MTIGKALAGFVLIGAANTLWSDDVPPQRFQGEAAAAVFYLSPADVRQACGSAPAGITILACSHPTKAGWVTVLPNPCLLADREEYARLACHEKGHTLGWSAMHEQ